MTAALQAGQIVRVRQRQYFVEEIVPPNPGDDSTLVRMACLDDDAQGQPLEVLARELLIRKKVQNIVVSCPPSMLLQWQDELEERFGMVFQILDKDYNILKLRELHAAMDRAVLDAYGWTDLNPTCEFLLDYEEDEDEDESGGSRRRKKPWRYRWPDEFRDEVLARLLELNRQRAEEERLSGLAAEGSVQSPKRAKKASRKKPSDQPELF